MHDTHTIVAAYQASRARGYPGKLPILRIWLLFAFFLLENTVLKSTEYTYTKGKSCGGMGL